MEDELIFNFDNITKNNVDNLYEVLTYFVLECSSQYETTPRASVFLSKVIENKSLPTPYLLAIILATILCLTILALGFIHGLYIKSYVTDPFRRIIILYLAGTAPFVSTLSLTSMYMPRVWFLSHLISFLYFSIGLYFVICLLMQIVDGRSSMVKKMTQKSCEIRFSTRPLCCFMGCLPTISADKHDIRILEYMVLQNPCVRLFATIISLILYFEYTDQAFVYLKILDFVFLPSLLAGIYGCHILVTTVSKLDELIPYRYIVVFRLLDIYFAFFGLQQPIFDFLARAGVFECGNGVMNAIDTAFFWKNFATIVESFIVSLISSILLKPGKTALFDKYPSRFITSMSELNARVS